MGRMISLMGLDTVKVPGMTVNRYCVGFGNHCHRSCQDQGRAGRLHRAGGVECKVPDSFGGWKIVPNYKYVQSNPDYYWGMGLHLPKRSRGDFKVSREDPGPFRL